MRKRIFATILYALMIVSSLSLSGCAIVPSLELTAEEQSLVAEYAAGKLLEYAKGHPGGLMILEDVDRTEVNPGLKKEEPEPEPEPLVPAPVPETPLPPPEDGISETPAEPSGDALVDSPDDAVAAATKPIAEALGIENAEVEFDRAETLATYPDDGELAFSMKAAPGKKLLIAHFALSNPGSEEVNVHTDSTGFKVRLRVNGGDKIRCDVTFLDNDLMNYDGLLTPGASVDSVLVFEVDENTEVETMDLIIIENGEEMSYTLM